MNQQRSNKISQDQRRARILLLSLALLAIVVTLLLIVILLRTLKPNPQPGLQIMPATGLVEPETVVAVSGSGWPKNEDVAICLNQPGDATCSQNRALVVERAGRDGSFETSLQVGSQLAQGLVLFAGQGTQSGLTASKTFRVLVSPGQPLPTATPEVLPGSTDTPTPPSAIPTPEPTTPVAFDTWRGEYFANPDLNAPPAVVRDDPAIAFDWGSEAPDPALPADNFSVRWSRTLPLEGRKYRFTLEADGGVRLFVDGQLLIDHWQDEGGVAGYSTQMELLPGDHDLLVAYYNGGGDASVRLDWRVDDDFPEWRGEYYANADLAGDPLVVRGDPAVNFDWGLASPIPGVLGEDGFSARWTRRLNFAQGNYRFTLQADDGARLAVDGQVLIDAWGGASDQPASADLFMAEGDHDLEITYFENVGEALVNLGWLLVPEETATPVPSATPTDTPTTPASPTPTDTPVPQETATTTPSPTPELKVITLTPTQGWAGTVITITSQGWLSDTLVTVALADPATDISQAEDLPDTSQFTGADGTVTVVFTFPDETRWLERPVVQVYLHDEQWRVWGLALFSLVQS